MRIILFPIADGSNTYFVTNDINQAILIDPGSNTNNVLINKIKRENLDIKYILLTHGHYDHIRGLKDVCNIFPEVEVYIGSEDEICLTNERYNVSNLSGYKLEPYTPKNLHLVTDNEELNLLGYQIKVIHTPFHTMGSVCYYFPSLEVLFSGDTLFRGSIGRTDLVGSEPRKINDSLRKLTKLPINTKVYPGHENMTTIEREMKYNIYIKEL